ncbi:NADH-quinone oxidoreductase subunit M [Nitratifractor sp.]
MENILSVLIFFPLLAALLGILVSKETIRVYGITVAAIEFLLTLWLWFAFDGSNGGFQFIEYMPLISDFGINYYLGVDGISLFIVVMAALMTLIGIIALGEVKKLKNMIISLLLLEVAMIGVFVSLDAIVFYLFWEFSLVPMLYIIGYWGGEKRLYAAIKFFLYTFAGSLIMLVGMLYVAYVYQSVSGVWSFALTDWYALVLPLSVQKWLFWAFFLGFAIKVPMFPFHTWLPYAHGQAPTIGSVILAAVLLKMGTYGFVRFSLPMFPDASVAYILPVAVIAIIMIIYTAMVAYAQKDMKQVVAYSSISHMGVIVLGTFAMNVEGIAGSVFLMLSHGIVSGALFLLVGVIYDRRHTKLMSEFGGLASVMPKYAVIFGIMLMASVGLPLTIGFVGEYLSLAGIFKVSPTMALLGGFSIILGAVYMLSLYKKSFFGPVTKEENRKLSDLNGRELTALVPLVAIVVWLGVYPKPVLAPIDTSVKALVKFMNEKAQTPEAKTVIHVSKSTKEAR